jgi:hypothetical protein
MTTIATQSIQEKWRTNEKLSEKIGLIVDEYKCGKIVVKGKSYSSDLILYPNRIQTNWGREEEHQVGIKDLEEIIAAYPEYLIIGTGNGGSMNVLPETQTYVKAQGIQLVFMPTASAYKLYNAICTKRRTIGAFHLAC